MTAYGNFAFAYLLTPGDVPQMPYPLSSVTSCSPLELAFVNKEIWFSISPDSALIKIGLFSPDSSKLYAALKNISLFENYMPNLSINFIKDWDFNCDSSNIYFESFATDVDTSQQYLLKFTRHTMLDCSGIYDTSDYLLNLCLINLRMQTGPLPLEYSTEMDLLNYLGNIGNIGSAVSGDIIIPALGSANLELNFDAISSSMPLVIGDGIILSGNFDLLSHDIEIPFNGGYHYITNTNPLGTFIQYNHKGSMPGNVLNHDGYMFIMRENSQLRNIKLQGAMPGFQDHNDDIFQSGGIRLENSLVSPFGSILVSHCELYNFSYAGIFTAPNIENVNFENVNVHRVRGSGGGETTKAKGYGIWLQGINPTNLANGYDFNLTNCLIDECKTGVDLQHNPLDLSIDKTTFGSFFTQETINRHNYTTPPYLHPPTGISCDYYVGATPISITSSYNISDNSSGDISIKNSIFFQNRQVISVNYPVNTLASNFVYNINISQNTFVAEQGNTSPTNFGGYARISDNYIESCTWDYERITNSTNNIDKILVNTPNFHDYHPDANVLSTCSTCPTPPKLTAELDDYDGLVPGFSPTSSEIPFIVEGGDFEVKIENPLNENLAYIVRAHPNNSSASGNNYSGDNPFNNCEIVTDPSNTLVTIPFSLSSTKVFDTNKPGLYGVDITAVNGSVSPAPYYTSQLIHKPIIVAPTQNHLLIFNVKDSYFADLYDNLFLPSGKVFKQVELNGNVIWSEDVIDGGDDWEQVQIDLIDGVYNGVPNSTHFISLNPMNTITFSIALADPGDVGIDQLRGIKMWVDDVYLKKYGYPHNLIKDGGIENSPYGGLSNSSTEAEMWYEKNNVISTTCLSLDYKIASNVLASSQASVGFLDRKSGSKAITLELDGLHEGILDCDDYKAFTGQGSNGEMISAAFDFDYREFLDCDDYLVIPGYVSFSSLNGSSYNVTSTPVANTFNGKNIVVSQDIIVSGSIGNTTILSLEGSNVVFLSDTKIELDEFSELYIDDYNGSPSRLFACGDMWTGIENNGGKVIIRPSSSFPTQIWDANAAITSIGGRVNIRYAEFDHNYIGLDLSAGDFRPSSYGDSDGLLGIKFLCTSGTLSRQPWTGEPTNSHIILNDVTDISIGGISSWVTSAYTNYFSNAVYGIKLTNSVAKIENNDFKNMADFSDVHPCHECGTGIYAINTELSSLDLRIGGNINASPPDDTYLKNVFSDSKNGILAKGNFNLTAQGNQFNSLKQGIRTNRNRGDVMVNIQNSFDEVTFGIVASNVHGEIQIYDNIFSTVPIPTEPHSEHFKNTAITIQNSIASTVDVNKHISIYNNAITDYRIGIHGININSIGVGYNHLLSTVSGNIITYTIESFPLVNYHGGIWIQNCSDAKITGNVITNTEFNQDINFKGIDIESSLNCDINCNIIDNLCISIHMHDDCGLTDFRGNIMSNFLSGILLSGNIGGRINFNQGYDENALDNEWFRNGNIGNKVDGTPWNAVQINWFHQDANSSNVNFSPNPWNGNMIAPDDEESSGFIGCEDFLINSGNRIRNYGAIVGDSVSYNENVSENHYLARKNAFYAMRSDSTLIYVGDSLDASFIDFYKNIDSTNIGKFKRISDIIVGFPDSASSQLELIITGNELEEYLKEFYSFYLGKILNDSNYLQSDSIYLNEMSNLNATLSGDVYFYTLATLFKEQHPEENSMRQLSSKEPIFLSPLDTGTSLIIFPNPANSQISLILTSENYKVFKIDIFNSLGEKVFEKLNSTGICNIDISKFKEGVYFIKCSNDKNQSLTETISIIR